VNCSSCRNYRKAVAGRLGFCGLDRRRDPLHGDEMRGCWEAPPPDTPLDGLGLFAVLDPRSVTHVDSGQGAERTEVAARRLVEAPAVAPAQHLSPSVSGRSAEPEGRHHIEQRTIR